MTDGSPQDALDTACGLYLNDPGAWTQPPKNQRGEALAGWCERARWRWLCRPQGWYGYRWAVLEWWAVPR